MSAAASFPAPARNALRRPSKLDDVLTEALLAIVADRLRGFQSGALACDDNQDALKAVENALYWLKQRTKARIERSAEGTHAV